MLGFFGEEGGIEGKFRVFRWGGERGRSRKVRLGVLVEVGLRGVFVGFIKDLGF